jgi:hypothetical protein
MAALAAKRHGGETLTWGYLGQEVVYNRMNQTPLAASVSKV